VRFEQGEGVLIVPTGVAELTGDADPRRDARQEVGEAWEIARQVGRQLHQQRPAPFAERPAARRASQRSGA